MKLPPDLIRKARADCIDARSLYLIRIYTVIICHIKVGVVVVRSSPEAYLYVSVYVYVCVSVYTINRHSIYIEILSNKLTFLLLLSDKRRKIINTQWLIIVCY